MLKSVRVKNFKILSDAQFSLSNLTVLSGYNGVGKSCLIQSLLLLRQSYERNVLANCLLLDDKYVSVGLGRDALKCDAEEKQIAFELEWDDPQPTSSSRMFVYDSDSVESCDFMHASKHIETNDLGYLSLFNHNFQYVPTSISGSDSEQKRSGYHVEVERTIGVHGEYLAHFIHAHGRNKVKIPELIHVTADSSLLIDSINGWLRELTNGHQVVTVEDELINTVLLRFAVQYDCGEKLSPYMRPDRVGPSVVHALAVIVAILSADKGDLIILEHPDNNLHGSAQSALGRLCALAAKNGVQVIIETHSEHIVNGARVAVRKYKIDPEAISVIFMTRNFASDSFGVQIQTPKMDAHGLYDTWPTGFFDQAEHDLEHLL